MNWPADVQFEAGNADPIYAEADAYVINSPYDNEALVPIKLPVSVPPVSKR
jgi:hypothetical protein